MAEHNEIGARGESLATNYLVKEGYQILEQNWRSGRVEVDIIAMDRETLVFVEVKTRRYHPQADPSLAISPKKADWIKDAAAQYMDHLNHEWAIRFDVISLLIYPDESFKLEHHRDSFTPW